MFSSKGWVPIIDVNEDDASTVKEEKPDKANVEDDDKSLFFNPNSRILEIIKSIDKKGIIGLEYLVEVISVETRKINIYCFLCHQEPLDLNNIGEHVISAAHRLRYLEHFFPRVHQKFAKVPNLKFWQEAAFDFLESVVSRIQARMGMLNPLTVRGDQVFKRDLQRIERKLENGTHLTESPQFNFVGFPDPFGSFLRYIPPEEVVSLPKEMPAIKPVLGNKSETIEPKVEEGEGKQPEAKPEKPTKVRRHLRKPISDGEASDEDESQFRLGKQLETLDRKGATVEKEKEKKRERWRQNLKSGSRDVKDEKPDDQRHFGGSKRSQSRNRSRSRSRDRKPRITTNNKRSRNRSRSRDRYRSRSRDRHRMDSDGAGNAKRWPPSSHQGGQSAYSSGGQRYREDDELRSQRYPSRDRSPGASPEVPRSYARQNHVRDRERSRSLSPYSNAMKKWKKFKVALDIMKLEMDVKKATVKEKPEDHPQYEPEWQKFWAMRFQQLKAEGRDTVNHDYQAEWIPFWLKRQDMLIEEEIKKQTENLLKRYGLETPDKPERKDYMPRSPPPKKKHIESFHYCPPAPSIRDQLSREESRSPSPPPRKRSDNRRTRLNLPLELDLLPDLSASDYHFSDGLVSASKDVAKDPWSKSSRNAAAPPKSDGRNPSPPPLRLPSHDTYRDGMMGQGWTGPSRLESNSDLYSGLTDLEDKRDHGVSFRSSRSPSPRSTNRPRSPSPIPRALMDGLSYHDRDSSVESRGSQLIPLMRLLTAMEDCLGSLGPFINQILGQALSLEQSREGASKILMENPDTISILGLTKEKLAGQLAASLLPDSRIVPARLAVDCLVMILQVATKKRTLNPLRYSEKKSGSDVTAAIKNGEQEYKTELDFHLSTDEDVMNFFIKSVSSVLVLTDRSQISDDELLSMLSQLMTDLAASDTSCLGKTAQSFLEEVRTAQLDVCTFQRKKVVEARSPTPEIDSYQCQEIDSSHNDQQESQPSDDNKSESNNQTESKEPQSKDEGNYDEWTVDELSELLDTYENLSKTHQQNLLQYMRKLEEVNPDRLNELWASKRNKGHQSEAEVKKPANPSDVSANDDRSKVQKNNDGDKSQQQSTELDSTTHSQPGSDGQQAGPSSQGTGSKDNEPDKSQRKENEGPPAPPTSSSVDHGTSNNESGVGVDGSEPTTSGQSSTDPGKEADTTSIQHQPAPSVTHINTVPTKRLVTGPHNPVGRLYELCQNLNWPAPVFKSENSNRVKTECTLHCKSDLRTIFTVGFGNNHTESKREAAKTMLFQLSRIPGKAQSYLNAH